MNLPRNSAIRKVPIAKDHSALRAGFTMIEIALCLAVIGFALVAIIGVLPIGMNVQKDNREETIINFDANYLMDAIRSGSRGLDNLTNYVIAITNTFTLCHTNGVPSGPTQINWYTPIDYSLKGTHYPTPALTNGTIIMGLLSQPKYIPFDPVNTGDYWSNSVTATFRAITGSPLDQGTSQASKDFAFSYLVTVEIIPNAEFPFAYWDGKYESLSAPGTALGTNGDPAQIANWPVAKNLQNNLNEIRLRFRWPFLPSPVNKLGNGAEVFRTSASGPLITSPNAFLPPGEPVPPVNYYLIQPLIYTNAP